MRKFLFAAYLILLSVPVFADQVQSQFSMRCESKDSPFCRITNDTSEKITDCAQLTNVARPAMGQVYLIDHDLRDTCTEAQWQQIRRLKDDRTCAMAIHYLFTDFSNNFPTHMVAWCDKDTSVNITYDRYNLNCIPQDTNSSRTGVLKNPDHKWLYCGGFSSNNDCGTGTYVLGIDNKLYRCQVDQKTKEGTWTALDISDIEWCRSSLTSDTRDSRPFNDTSNTKQIMNTDRTHILGFLYRNKAIGSDAIESFCYEDVQTCTHNKTVENTTYIYLNQDICNNIENMPVWGQTDENQDESQAGNITITGTVVDNTGATLPGVDIVRIANNGSRTTDGTITDINGNFTLPGLKSDESVRFSFVGFEPLTKTVSELQSDNSQIVLQDAKPSEEEGEEEEGVATATTPTQTVITQEQIDAAQQKLTDAQQKLNAAREKQNSLGNRLVNAGASAATGYGARMIATSMAEQAADSAAESDMREWLTDMKCEYGNGQQFDVGNETIYLPGGDEISDYATEYKDLAGELKKTKAALGLKPGIESETIYDRADYDLYSYEPGERQSGENASVSRALMGDDTKWAAQKEESEQNKKIGTGLAIGGVAAGVIGNTAINTDAIQKIGNVFKKN